MADKQQPVLSEKALRMLAAHDREVQTQRSRHA